MLLAIRRWRSERSCSAWPWKSSESVNRLSIANLVGAGVDARPEAVLHRRGAIVRSGRADISANSAAFAGLFEPWSGDALSTVAAMLSIVLLAPLARVAPRRLGWRIA